MSTKQKILEAAITLFADKGYSDVSIRQITRAVGIKESSLYNHFTSKQQILDNIIDYLSQELEKINMPEDIVIQMIEKMSIKEFLQFSAQAFQAYMGNPLLIKIWRILSMERFKIDRANDFFKTTLIDNAVNYQSKVFYVMMKRGLVRELDPILMAREFYSYILYVYFRYFEMEKYENPAENKEVQQMIKDHLIFFTKVISKQEKN